MSKTPITKEAVEKTLQDGARSMSEIYRALGGKSKVSSSFSSKIRSICTNVDDRLLENKGQASGKIEKSAATVKATVPTTTPAAKPTKTAATPKKQPKTKAKQPSRHIESSIPRAKSNPFRAGSAYSLVFDALYQNRAKGISRMDLLTQVVKASKKPEALCKYDLSVVLSSRKDGSCHRSAKSASNIYWVDRENDWCQIHLRQDQG